MKVERILDAKAEVITLSEARSQARISDELTDDMLRIYIEAARNHVEDWAENALVESTYAFYFDESQASYEIYRPINSITTFEYKTDDNTGTYSGSLTGGDYHLNSDQGLITLNDSVMTDIIEQSNAVKITAVAGQSNVGKIKANIRLAMLLMISHWNENRENTVTGTIIAEIPMGAKDLLAFERKHAL